ncbi:MAG: gluconate 2-dehydrogenase subunit 3 family protein [Thiotrichales bacterium]|nr:gluconate 2-dehydrogenase subunit 3 family protein [Thiotrichales bacterium]
MKAFKEGAPYPVGLLCSRRSLLQLGFVSLANLGFVPSLFASESLQSADEPWHTLQAVQNHLMPASPEFPSAQTMNALSYVQQKYLRPLADQHALAMIKQGVGWLNGFAQSDYQAPFVALNTEQKERLLQKVAKSRAGERWLARLLDDLLEAMLTDPIYGGNPNGLGWQAVGQIPGFPRPQSKHRYFLLGYPLRQQSETYVQLRQPLELKQKGVA